MHDDDEMSYFYYINSFAKPLLLLVDNSEEILVRNLTSAGGDSLAMQPMVLCCKTQNSVEIILVCKEKQTEKEWEEWYHKHAKRWNTYLGIQLQMMVPPTNCECCVDRLIEKHVVENSTTVNENEKHIIIRSHFFDAFRIASNGQMHFYDVREWAVSETTFAEMRARRLRTEWKIQEIWERRIEISNQIDMARDILDLSIRLAPFKIERHPNNNNNDDDDDHSSSSMEQHHYYSMPAGNQSVQLKFTPMFDLHDIQALEDKELDLIVETNKLSIEFDRVDKIIQRQRKYMEFARKKAAVVPVKKKRNLGPGGVPTCGAS